MAIVTGDRYLDFLVKFVEKEAGPLLEGTLVLKLNPVGLHYVQSRLEALQELEGLLAGAPVDYLRAYISDLGDHRALEQLRRILRLLTSLKVVSVFPPPARDPTPLSLLPFGRLKVLELRGCDLSTSSARGLLELRHTLEKIVCHNSTDALRHVFASRIVDIKDSPMWKKLSFVSCACNDLVLMDESLQLLPNVETLDLSRNKFGKLDNLRKCTKLKHLDLGFNHLRSISSFNEVASSIVKLVLRSNALTTLRGIENLKSVEGLDLSYNIISNVSELEILAGLPSLQSLWLEGNPLCCVRWYRAQVFSLFTHPDKKRLSRLALIEDEEQRRHFISEAEHESMSCDGDIQSREGSAISDGEAKIVDLMNRVESMKQEHSVLWLREFKEWMDLTSVDNNKFSGLIGPGKENYMKKKRGRKYLEESSRYIADSLLASGDESSTDILEPDNSPPNALSGLLVYQSFNSTGEATTDSSMVECSGDGRPRLEVGQIDLKQVQSKAVVNDSFLSDTSVARKGDTIDAKNNIMSVTAIDEFMESRSSSVYPGSPPHYQEDILHRRHNLEEEFMQLSVESYSLASSDSDTSFAEDDFCRSETSLPEDNRLSIEQFSKGVMDDHSEVLLLEGSYCDEGQESSFITQNGRFPIDACADQDLLSNAAACDTDSAKNQDAACLEKKKGKWKSKRRIISLSEDDYTVGNIGPLSQKQNGVTIVSMTDMDIRGGRVLDGSNFQEISFDNSVNVTDISSYHLTTVESVKNYFHANVADASSSEICLQSMLCDCVILKESEYRESEVVILLSSGNKFYVFAVTTFDESGSTSVLMGSHRLEEIMDVVIGIGLQILRVDIEIDSTYLFITKSIERSRELLSLLRFCDSGSVSSSCALKSLEQAQVELFEKHVCGGSKMSIFFYSMLLFWCTNNEEKSWLSRSLVVIEGYLLLCVEDLVQFSSADDALSSPYFTLDSCCSIGSISEMVIEPRCVTLTLDCVTLEELKRWDNPEEEKLVAKLEEKMVRGCETWKLKWFSEETLVKFVALLKALHAATSVSPLPVRCIS